jgi:hypothetical protein
MTRHVARRIDWSREPEMERWMLGHDHGQRIAELCEEFRGRWGFSLDRQQVSHFRLSHGTQRRRASGGGRRDAPIGAERERAGYVEVKVRERPSTPSGRDNWALKHVLAYERAHGPVPEGHVVLFADGDRRNFDPDNLVAVPRRVVAVLNKPSSPSWHDRETLEACVAIAELSIAARERSFDVPVRCGVCGREFMPRRDKWAARPQMTCPECLRAGHRATSGRAASYDYWEIRRLYESGMSKADVARAVGCSRHTVTYALDRTGGSHV